MVAVDSNILGYLLLEGAQTARAHELLQWDPDWHSDAFVLVGFTNILATMMRVRGLPLRQAVTALTKAESVVESGLHAANHIDVLALAAQLRISAYDARFLAVASDLGLPLVTENAKLRKAAPRLTQSLAEALTAA